MVPNDITLRFFLQRKITHNSDFELIHKISVSTADYGSVDAFALEKQDLRSTYFFQMLLGLEIS